MIEWIKRALGVTPRREVYIELEADPRRVEQLAIQSELGISAHDDTQAWLRLHQILKDHEDRLAALEAPKPRRKRGEK